MYYKSKKKIDNSDQFHLHLEVISSKNEMLLDQVMASLTAVNHILPSPNFQNSELVIQIIAIKISQSRT